MTIRRSFEILELHPEATLEEVKLAYKDSVTVWHPDRFSHNPRLRQKAEQKLKEINAAFEEIKAFLSSREGARVEDDPHEADEPRDRAEVIAEAGTRVILGIWSYFSEALSQALSGRGGTARESGRRRPVQEAPSGDEGNSG